MNAFSNLVRVGKLTHKASVIKTQAGWPGRKLQVMGSDPAKAV